MPSDEAIIEQFEEMTLPVSELNHVGHLHIAWLYLRKHELDYAIRKVAVGTKSYAENLGVYDKFHHTLTEATVRIIKLRMQNRVDGDFETFLRQNEDMVVDLKSLLESYYSEEVLLSDVARDKYVAPDKQPLK